MFHVCFAIFALAFSGALLPSSATESYRDVTISTSVGEVALRVYGSAEASQAELVLCIPGMSKGLVWEWANVAEPLSREGYTVAILNLFHSKETRPGTIRTGELQVIITENIVGHYFKKAKFTLMGKSWGGANSIEYALKHPQMLNKLVLVAPAGGHILVPTLLNDKELSKLPLFLAWARDDPIAANYKEAEWSEFSKTRVLQMKVIPSGGHTVNREFAAPIIQFIKRTVF